MTFSEGLRGGVRRVSAGAGQRDTLFGRADMAWFEWPWPWWTYASLRRANLDMAEKGYIYVPPSCRSAGIPCHVHIALHGCKQNPKDFAVKAGYNNWAEQYHAIIVYPALEPSTPGPETCEVPADVYSSVEKLPFKPNPNGCWNWWGYLALLNFEWVAGSSRLCLGMRIDG